MNEQSYYMRNIRTVVVTSGANILLISDKGSVLEHRTDCLAKWSQLMQELATTQPRSRILELISTLPDLDNIFWKRLLDEGYVLESHDEKALRLQRDEAFTDNQGYHFAPAEPACEHLIFACTGSIVAGLMAPIILSLSYSHFQRRLDVILTESAQKFVTRKLFESYGIRTWGDAFERSEDIYVPHVQLGRSADCILVMPASANSLHRLASAACTDLLSMTITASHSPIVVAPVMNSTMWNHRAVQRNVEQLRQDGMYIIEPTIIFGAADLITQSAPMYGGHGTLWAGPRSLMYVLSAILKSYKTPNVSAPNS